MRCNQQDKQVEERLDLVSTLRSIKSKMIGNVVPWPGGRKSNEPRG